MIEKYILKPVEVEAVQYTPETKQALIEWCHPIIDEAGEIYLDTYGMVTEIELGDFVVLTDGVHLPVKPENFFNIYEKSEK